MGRFSAEASLHVTSVDAGLETLFAAPAEDLLGFNWHPFIHHSAYDVIHRMANDLQKCRAGHYVYLSVSKVGDRLFVRTSTLLKCVGGLPVSVCATVALLHRESARTFVC